MAIAWIAIKHEPHLMAAFRTLHWEVKEFSPAEFQQATTSQTWDVEVILIELSDGSLLDLCQEICSKKTVPVLVLAADLAYAQAALEVGVDDFIVVPADSIETLLRVRKLVRVANFVRVGALEIDLAAARVRYGGCYVHLSNVEFRMLACLAKRVGQTVSYAEMLEALWGGQMKEGALKQVKNGINRVRRKIEPDLHHPQYVITIPGEGYRLRNHRQWKQRTQDSGRVNRLPDVEEKACPDDL